MFGVLRRLGRGRTLGRAFKTSIEDPSSSVPAAPKASRTPRARRKKAPRPMMTQRSGLDILHDPLLNKGTAWPKSERERLGLRGLVPPSRLLIGTQMEKVLRSYRAIEDPLQRNLFLCNMLDRNEVLFYKLVCENIEEMAPVIYTPTVGQAARWAQAGCQPGRQVCQRFGDVFTRARGMYFSAEDEGEMSSMIYNWPHDNVQAASRPDAG